MGIEESKNRDGKKRDQDNRILHNSCCRIDRNETHMSLNHLFKENHNENEHNTPRPNRGQAA